MTKFYFSLMSHNFPALQMYFSLFPVMQHLQSSIFVGLKLQGISGQGYLGAFCSTALGFISPAGKASTEELAKSLHVITNKILTCCKAKTSAELWPFTPRSSSQLLAH